MAMTLEQLDRTTAIAALPLISGIDPLTQRPPEVHAHSSVPGENQYTTSGKGCQAMSEIDAKVDGLKAFYEKLDQISRDVTGSPMGAAMGRATLLVTRHARKNAPVDRGPLRASIVPEVVMRDKIVRGIVGSNIEYAPYQELGTRPFWPPWKPLYEWALRKTKGNRKEAGALAAGARIAIAARGIKAKRFLQNALIENAQRIYRIIGDTVGRIVRR